MGTFIGAVVFGAVVGVLARLVLPGRQQINALVTVILGVVGALIGYVLADLLNVGDTKGVDWIRWLISVVVAAILVTAYERVTAARKHGHPVAKA